MPPLHTVTSHWTPRSIFSSPPCWTHFGYCSDLIMANIATSSPSTSPCATLLHYSPTLAVVVFLVALLFAAYAACITTMPRDRPPHTVEIGFVGTYTTTTCYFRNTKDNCRDCLEHRYRTTMTGAIRKYLLTTTLAYQNVYLIISGISHMAIACCSLVRSTSHDSPTHPRWLDALTSYIFFQIFKFDA